MNIHTHIYIYDIYEYVYVIYIFVYSETINLDKILVSCLETAGTRLRLVRKDNQCYAFESKY
jgi:hypothetical protein